MSYNPITDFPALMRLTAGGERFERMPGLDFVVDALARAGMISLHVGQSAPVANQSTTAWFLPASPSWTAEGVLFLWNATTMSYQVATPALWTALFAVVLSGYSFQSAVAANNNIAVGTTILAVQRDNGNIATATALVLPNLGAQWALYPTRKLQIVDFSTNILSHDITISTADGSTIMQRNNFQIFSTPDQLAGISLLPVPDLNAWVITP